MKKYTHLLLTFMLLFSFGFASNKDAENQSLVRNEMKFYSDHIIDTTEVINDRIRIIGGDLFNYRFLERCMKNFGTDTKYFRFLIFSVALSFLSMEYSSLIHI